MSDISATNCGCGCDQEVTRNFGCFGGGNNCCSIIWILLLLNCFCGDNWNGGGCGCGSGNDNSCMWIFFCCSVAADAAVDAAADFFRRKPGCLSPVSFLSFPAFFSVSSFLFLLPSLSLLLAVQIYLINRIILNYKPGVRRLHDPVFPFFLYHMLLSSFGHRKDIFNICF